MRVEMCNNQRNVEQIMSEILDITLCDCWGRSTFPDSKVHEANMGPTWVLSAPDGPHVDPMNFAIRDHLLGPPPPGTAMTGSVPGGVTVPILARLSAWWIKNCNNFSKWMISNNTDRISGFLWISVKSFRHSDGYHFIAHSRSGGLFFL